MNDQQGSYWVVIVVPSTHRPLAATSGRSAPRSHRHQAVLSPAALTYRLRGRADFCAFRLTALLDRFDDQHFIATSLKLVRYAPGLNAEAVFHKIIAHELNVGRWRAIERKQWKHTNFVSDT